MKITREFSFDSAHMLPGHIGKCSRIHGHTYRMFVSVEGILPVRPRKAMDPIGVEQSSDGMLIDFGDLDALVKTVILDRWDHRFLANGDEWPIKAHKVLDYISSLNFYYVNVRTTCENLSALAAKLIGDYIFEMFVSPSLVKVSVELFEGLKNSAVGEYEVTWLQHSQ